MTTKNKNPGLTSDKHGKWGKFTLGDIINGVESNSISRWYEIMEIEISELSSVRMEIEALEVGNEGQNDKKIDKLLDKIVGLEDDYVREHMNDWYRVWWPIHVLTPKFNGDATYARL